MSLISAFQHLCFRALRARLPVRRPQILAPDDAQDRVLVISAHADDEALGCAASVEYLHPGSQVLWVVVSDGRNANRAFADPATMAGLRKEEAGRFAELLGWELDWWGHACPFELDERLVLRLTAVARRWQPGIVYVPCAFNHHREHRIIALAVQRHLRQLPMRGYAIQTPVTPVLTQEICHFAGARGRTEELLSLYPSQQFMRLSFEAAILMGECEGTIYLGRESYVQCFSVWPDLAANLEAWAPAIRWDRVKPNRAWRLAFNYLHAWRTAARLARDENWNHHLSGE